MTTPARIAFQEIQRLAKRPDFIRAITANITWTVGDNDVSSIRYTFENPQRVQEILRVIPYEEPEPETFGDETDNTLAGIHPGVNKLFSTTLFEQERPIILYLQPDIEVGDYDRLEYNNIRSLFDVLGAINTYYNEKTQGEPELILGDHIYFEGLTSHEDGYTVHFGS